MRAVPFFAGCDLTHGVCEFACLLSCLIHTLRAYRVCPFAFMKGLEEVLCTGDGVTSRQVPEIASGAAEPVVLCCLWTCSDRCWLVQVVQWKSSLLLVAT